MQPIYQGDVTRCLLAALDHAWSGPHTMVIAGPEPLSYRDFLRAVAAASGAGDPWVVAMPAGPLIALAGLARFLPGLPRVEGAEIRRLLEDKAFDITAMRAVLGVAPIPLREGLARTFAPDHGPGSRKP